LTVVFLLAHPRATDFSSVVEAGVVVVALPPVWASALAWELEQASMVAPALAWAFVLDLPFST